ncbi:heme NO-binding domain-containing protein [Pontibacter silvestris]|uniref:Heme NO-binding domain-containing protein n=1 Tax=Pontibacter silvestris TaxID=2305183 RepID=A0ABW4X312_9BACT|nr:heme NO-binding domain-containing protein [Pontibacter silvestris]MCC9134976.1 heme NO-binding domain-containing protein [Pontibacter silvestris]
MHGFIFLQFKKFIQQEKGLQAWHSLIQNSNVSRGQFAATEIYPDEDLKALVNTAATTWNIPVSTLLEQLGSFLVPDLIDIYQLYINPTWRTLDLVEQTENSMHRAVRVSAPEATPPVLHVTRINATKLIIDYHSQRRMAQLAIGIIKGVSTYYNEADKISILMQEYSGGDRVQIEVNYTP